MFSIFRGFTNVKMIYRTISMKTNNIDIIKRLEYITKILSDNSMYSTNKNKHEIDLYLKNLRKEKDVIFKHMNMTGDLNIYMKITKDFTGHTYN